LIEDRRPDVVISDVLTTAPALAAEAVGVRRATLVPHVWPEHSPGLPFFGFGLLPPRTRLGRWAWSAAEPVLEAGLRQGRRELNEARETLGLPPLIRFHGGTSQELALVATFPQLEYPRRWPGHVQITGPLLYELPGGDVVAPGDETGEEARPLVIVAPSTAKDPDRELIRVAMTALADEPVRVVATTNRQTSETPIEVPANADVVDWLSYKQLMPHAALVICHGGHGTAARALSCGAPVLVSPVDGDMAENGARLSWAGCGLMIPRRLTRPGTVRRAVRLILGSRRFADRAAELSRWATANDSPARAAAEIERLVC
jgi:UDP:flavonoid glycosyltransferase YjiC (YdhE family)